ncbi:MAG TPA: hypothetical protein VGE56_07600 [Rhodocyclaceae bacterium]
MRFTHCFAATMLVVSSIAAAAVEIPSNPVLYHYEDNCSKLKAGSAESQKCRADALAELERNCQTLNAKVLTAPAERVANEKRKQAMWCDAAKQFKKK